jgi:two-component system sensor histidine kinase/response regulator
MNKKNNDINILIVDDTPEHIHIASSILKQLNYSIRAANSGTSALKLIEKKIPTLILLDVRMPDLDGFQVCKILKENPLYKDIAIIFITAAEDEYSISRGFSLGAQDYVVKPYNSSELLARVTTHIKLVSQKNELQYAYNELDKFCHTVSHDLKSPLLVIIQLINLLCSELNDSPSNDITNILNQITSKSEDTILMIERLLELSKINVLKCDFKPINLNDIAATVYNELSSLEVNRNLSFTCTELPIINGDETLIKILFQNILSNALKFSRTSNPAIINIDCKTSSNFVYIIFNDNGIGFDMKYSSKLFHVFERLHNKEDFEGSGVGLSIIKRIMERHNGSIQIYSQLNMGTKVTISFPI